MNNMTHFMDTQGNVFGFSAEDLERGYPLTTMRQMTDAEFYTWSNPTQTTDQVLQAIAARRWQEETKGIVFNGLVINTERDSQNLINGAVVSTLLDPDYVCNWKTSEGFIQLNAYTLKAVGLAVRTYVQACFDREGELVAAVQAGTYTSSMLDEGWPT